MRNAFIFGYGKHGKYLAHGLGAEGFAVKIVTADARYRDEALEDGCTHVRTIDVTKDSELEALGIKEDDIIVAVMEDEHLNVFVTLSLRALYTDVTIVAISTSIHMTQKLRMAGASQVIDLYEVSANRVHNLLHKPIATKLLDSLIGKESELVLRELEVPSGSFVDGVLAAEIDFASEEVMLLGMVDKELGDKFIFVTRGVKHKIDAGDILICIGKKEALDHFEAKLKGAV